VDELSALHLFICVLLVVVIAHKDSTDEDLLFWSWHLEGYPGLLSEGVIVNTELPAANKADDSPREQC
jgi:hypothetical protein